ncbi:hypothetical protein Tcan_00791, partial [Toxocara canis]
GKAEGAGQEHKRSTGPFDYAYASRHAQVRCSTKNRYLVNIGIPNMHPYGAACKLCHVRTENDEVKKSQFKNAKFKNHKSTRICIKNNIFTHLSENTCNLRSQR